jgi:methylamine dehydrogenase heavy chain
VYAAGKRRFLTLCGDGAVLVVTVDDTGRESGKHRTEPFFDPDADPVTEKAVRYRDQWLFVSFEGNVHPVDVAGEQVRFGEAWPLLSEADRDASWRIGGLQHLAVHEASGRFFSLMHRGSVDTHKEPGEEIWVYDLQTRTRAQRIELRSPGLALYGFPIEFGRRWVWPFNHLSEWLIDSFMPAEVSHIQVTQDDEPLLFTVSQFSGSIGTYDARSGAFLRRLRPVGWTNDLLVAPWGGRGAG